MREQFLVVLFRVVVDGTERRDLMAQTRDRGLRICNTVILVPKFLGALVGETVSLVEPLAHIFERSLRLGNFDLRNVLFLAEHDLTGKERTLFHLIVRLRFVLLLFVPFDRIDTLADRRHGALFFLGKGDFLLFPLQLFDDDVRL